MKKARNAVSLLLLLITGLCYAQSPDLVVNQSKLQGSIEIRKRKFQPSHCAIVEGCTVAGQRKLLRFDTGTPNIGNQDIVLGDPRNNPLFEFSPCHGHYHLTSYAIYELLNSSGTVVITGRKQAFCLLDSSKYLATAGPSNGYTCGNQGLTAGWQDVYSRNLDCQ